MTQVLKNKLFISTREKGKSGELKNLLEKAGAQLLEFPLIETRAAFLSESDKNVFHNLGQFNWLILTSPNGVYFFFKHLKKTTQNSQLPKSLKIAVIGSKTGKALEKFSCKASFINPGATAEDFVKSFPQKIKINPEKTILLALGNLARNTIQENLNTKALCKRVNVYETVAPKSVDKKILQRIQNGAYEMIIFTSPSGFHNFIKIAGELPIEKLRVACIGEITSRAVEEKGITPLTVAANPSAEGIVNSIITYYN